MSERLAGAAIIVGWFGVLWLWGASDPNLNEAAVGLAVIMFYATGWLWLRSNP